MDQDDTPPVGTAADNPLGVHPLDRVHVFIDAQNLFGMLRNMRRKLDYKRFMAFMQENTRLARMSYYTVVRDGGQDRSQSLLDMVEYAGYEVKRKNGYEVHDSNGYYRFKGSIVGEMTVGMINAAEAGVEHIIVMSGDGDFLAGIEGAKERGARITLICDTNSVNDEVRRACDAFLPITDLPDEVFFE